MSAKVWLGISIGLNITFACVLIGWWSVGTRTIPEATAGPAAVERTTQSVAAVGLQDESQRATTARLPEPGSSIRNWVELLRAGGASEEAMARMAAAAFDGAWQSRLRDIYRRFETGDLDEQALSEFITGHDEEQERELRSALGDEGFRRWDQTRVLQQLQLDRVTLTAPEAGALYELARLTQQERREIEAAQRRGELTEQEVAGRSEAKDAEFQNRLKEVLGAERYAEFVNANDPAAGELRRNLRAVGAGQESSDSMLAAHQSWASQRTELERLMEKGELAAADYEERMKTLEKSRDQEYQRLLGAEAYAEFRRAEDGRYRTMKRNAGTWGLSDGDVNKLYATIQYYENQVQDYRRRARLIEEQGQPVDWPAVDASLRAFSEQTEQALREYLGQERFDRLKQNHVLAFQDE